MLFSYNLFKTCTNKFDLFYISCLTSTTFTDQTGFLQFTDLEFWVLFIKEFVLIYIY